MSFLLGESKKMCQVRAGCALLAPRRRTAVLIGETGSGKGLVAEELLRQSGNTHAMVRITGAELRPEHMQSTLAGHVRGAFTSALQSRVGLLLAARGAFVFGDDFDHLEKLEVQPYLLDVMEGKPVRTMGTERTFIPHVRWVIGLQRSPEALVADGSLRADLAARWGIAHILVPPLREHPEDIAQLAPHLMQRIAAEEELPPLAIAAGVLDHLMQQPWPGNVRQLDAVLYAAWLEALAERAVVIRLHHLQDNVRRVHSAASSRRLDRVAIAEALASSGGVVARAAALLGVHTRTLWRHMRDLRMRRSDRASPLASTDA